ncbi:MAG: helix-turn-helix domain-containing protein [Bilophila wadsworthia]
MPLLSIPSLSARSAALPARRTGKADRCPPARRGLWAKWPGASASAQAGCTRCPLEWGLSPQAWLAERRIGHVRKWLAESDLPIADLALRAGYADQSALTAPCSA